MQEFTHDEVLQGIRDGADWADPTMDPTTIDWHARLREAWVPFDVIDGRPVNPAGPTGIRYGRNRLGHWGEKKAADLLVIAHVHTGGAFNRLPTVTRYLAMVKRGDGLGWAIPGGMVEPGESALQAAFREAREEISLNLVKHMEMATVWAARVVPDPRSSDEAWVATTPVVVTLTGPVPQLRGASDADQAEWVRADSYPCLVDDVEQRFGGKVFAAHVDLLREALGVA